MNNVEIPSAALELRTSKGNGHTAAGPVVPSSSTLRSVVAGCSFKLAPAGPGRVQVSVLVNGTATETLDVEPLADGAEHSLALRLARLRLPHENARSRELEACRLVAQACRVTARGSLSEPVSSATDRAEQFLASTDIDRLLMEDATSVGFSTDPLVGVTLILAKIGALLPEPVYVYLCGPASALKTSYADLTAKLTPAEMLKHLTDLTPKAIYYGETDLPHHVIALDEMDFRGRGLALDLKVLRMAGDVL